MTHSLQTSAPAAVTCGRLVVQAPKYPLRRRDWIIKRAIDYALSSALLVASLPVVAVMVVWIKRVDPGPALFQQERIGMGGRRVRIWKLRTMYCDAERRLICHLQANPAARAQWERCFKLRDDPRVLPGVGRFLRKTSLDEVPQFWNVLCGEMSLVGPRPLPRYHLEQFPRSFRSLRRRVLPGLTGLWQVSARGESQLAPAYDTYYIRNWSLWLDVRLLWRTVWAVLAGRGAS